MDKHQEHYTKAKRYLQVADHMTFVTYHVVPEPRIILSVLENIFLSFTNAMSSLLYYERMYKRVPIFADNFDSKFRIYKDRLERKFNFDKEIGYMIKEIKELLIAHKNSPMEFSRKGRLVICSESYRMRSVTIADVKRYLPKAKLFIEGIGAIIRP